MGTMRGPGLALALLNIALHPQMAERQQEVM